MLQSDRFVHHGNSPLPPFPSGAIYEEDASTDEVRAASTGALLDEKERLVLTRSIL